MEIDKSSLEHNNDRKWLDNTCNDIFSIIELLVEMWFFCIYSQSHLRLIFSLIRVYFTQGHCVGKILKGANRNSMGSKYTSSPMLFQGEIFSRRARMIARGALPPQPPFVLQPWLYHWCLWRFCKNHFSCQFMDRLPSNFDMLPSNVPSESVEFCFSTFLIIKAFFEGLKKRLLWVSVKGSKNWKFQEKKRKKGTSLTFIRYSSLTYPSLVTISL